MFSRSNNPFNPRLGRVLLCLDYHVSIPHLIHFSRWESNDAKLHVHLAIYDCLYLPLATLGY